ncbi:MAG: EVE domain-containing protein [Prochloraceae cyanobacterium]
MKSEPQVYSINDLQHEGQLVWDGVRNMHARNFLRQMKEGDLSFLTTLRQRVLALLV